ncbi:MAG: ATP-grasp domain-containing protein [Proteobacteria bacterium]|nr:ATP-grasp domain-containing protein [Pseudomonadota bacterium]
MVPSRQAVRTVDPALLPGILKTSRMGYDGKGQVRVGSREELATAWQDLQRVPSTLRQAATAFAKSDFARRAFGADAHEHYAHFFDVEATQYDNAVTDWERWRYFERI